MAWEQANGRSLRHLENERKRLAERPQSEGRLAQVEAQISAIKAKEPEVDFAVNLCLRAWGDLSTTRQIGMALGPVPVPAIYEWSDRKGFDDEAREIMTHVIRQLDVDRAEAEAAKAEIEKARGPGGRR